MIDLDVHLLALGLLIYYDITPERALADAKTLIGYYEIEIDKAIKANRLEG